MGGGGGSGTKPVSQHFKNFTVAIYQVFILHEYTVGSTKIEDILMMKSRTCEGTTRSIDQRVTSSSYMKVGGRLLL